MIKELILLPRVLYCVFFTLVGMFTTFSHPSDPKAFIGLFVFIFIFSFVWQYYILHFLLREMKPRQRAISLLIWWTISAVVGTWGLYSLASFDWFQDKSTLMQDFAWQMTIYLIGVSMFVGGACTRRAFERHKAL